MKYGQLTKLNHPGLVFRSNGHITKLSAALLRERDEKYCHACDTVLPTSCFHTDRDRLATMCKSCRRKLDLAQKRTINGRFSFAKSNAKKVGKFWALTFADYSDIVQLPCHYCSMPNDRCGIGLDRLDNSIGYELVNIVSCCMECNVARSDHFSVDEMVKYIGPAIRTAKLSRSE